MKVLRPTAPVRKLVPAMLLALVAGLLAGLPAPASAARSPQLSVGNSSHWERQSGTRYFVFTVRLANPTGRTVTVRYTTAGRTAHARTDYRSRHGKLTFRGTTVTRTIRVPVRGDRKPEANETFLVRLHRAHGAGLRDRTGVGTIRNDDQRLTVLRTGQGVGTVTSSTSGIACGTDCTHVYRRGTHVTLTAAADTGSSFAGWSGGGCTGTASTCTVRISSARSRQITADFDTALTAVNTLSVLLDGLGTGTGTVTSLPAGIACGLDCTEGYPTGTAVTLTAVPDVGSAFDGWSGGGCTGSLPTCVVTMDAARTVTATFRLLTSATFRLSVTTAGTGTVASVPPGIACPADCSEDYTDGTPVILTAVPGGGSAFDGWSGGGCSGTLTTCTVTMNAAREVSAAFRPLTSAPFPLGLDLAGTGTGTVTSLPDLNCPAACTGIFVDGTLVTLTALPATGSTFGGWSGDCTGLALTCVVPMTSARSVTATFDLPAPVTFRLDITRSGPGTVTSLLPGISCGPDCTQDYAADTTVTLTAVPGLVSTFTGWTGGGCTGTLPTCLVTMDQAKTVTATFT